MALDQIPEGIDIRGFDRVQADPIVHWALDPDHPALPADLDRNIQRGILRTGAPDYVLLLALQAYNSLGTSRTIKRYGQWRASRSAISMTM